MSYKKFFNSIVLMISLSFHMVNATVVRQICGDYHFEVKILNSRDAFERRFELFVINKSLIKTPVFKTKAGVYLYAKCIRGERGNMLMLFQLLCGGNGCPEDIYGIFDPNNKKLLIDPNDWPGGNGNKVRELIGYYPPYITGDNGEFFCCYKRQY